MEPLRTQFDDRTFRYTQIERDGDMAIFSQTHKLGQVTRYEVVRIRVQPERAWPDGRITPEREAYPGSSTWGRDGFTCFSLLEAKALAQSLQTGQQEQRAEE